MEERFILELKISQDGVLNRIHEADISDKKNKIYLLDLKTIKTFLWILSHTPAENLPEHWREHKDEWFKIRRIEIY